jgi:hypothetical protein
MFRQLVTPGHPGANPTTDVMSNINSLFTYHPLQISAIIETVWLNRNNAASSQTNSSFLPWSPLIASQILKAPFFTGYDWSHTPPLALYPVLPAPFTFKFPLDQPGIANTWNGAGTEHPETQPPAHPLRRMHSTNWDHLIYAYVIENTRIFEIFSKVLETYMFSEQLETPSAQSQLFWRNLEFLILGDAMPSMLWTTSSRSRRDEVANRLCTYYWMFGIDLSHAGEIAGQHPYQKPAASNRDFIPTFEAFGREVWRGIMNARNTSGANDTDPTVIATLARRIYDMMATRRINGNLSREEFRAVAVMSFLNLAVLYDSPAVVDLKATASSPEMRLQKIAERVGMTAHPKSKPFFDLAGPFSVLMQSIETGKFNHTTGAELLYLQTPGNFSAKNAETVIDQYTLATGRDLKSQPVSIVPRAATSSLPMSRRQSPLPQLAARPANGHGHGTIKQ